MRSPVFPIPFMAVLPVIAKLAIPQETKNQLSKTLDFVGVKSSVFDYAVEATVSHKYMNQLGIPDMRTKAPISDGTGDQAGNIDDNSPNVPTSGYPFPFVSILSVIATQQVSSQCKEIIHNTILRATPGNTPFDRAFRAATTPDAFNKPGTHRVYDDQKGFPAFQDTAYEATMQYESETTTTSTSQAMKPKPKKPINVPNPKQGGGEEKKSNARHAQDTRPASEVTQTGEISSNQTKYASNNEDDKKSVNRNVLSDDEYFNIEFDDQKGMKAYVARRFANRNAKTYDSASAVTKMIYMAAIAYMASKKINLTEDKVMATLATSREAISKLSPLNVIKEYSLSVQCGSAVIAGGRMKLDNSEASKKNYGNNVMCVAEEMSLLPVKVREAIVAKVKNAQEHDSQGGFAKWAFLPGNDWYYSFFRRLNKRNDILAEDVKVMVHDYTEVVTIFTFLQAKYPAALQSALTNLMTMPLNSPVELIAATITRPLADKYRVTYDSWSRGLPLDDLISMELQVVKIAEKRGSGTPIGVQLLFRATLFLVNSLLAKSHDSLAVAVVQRMFLYENGKKYIVETDKDAVGALDAVWERLGIDPASPNIKGINKAEKAKLIRGIPDSMLNFKTWVYFGEDELIRNRVAPILEKHQLGNDKFKTVTTFADVSSQIEKYFEEYTAKGEMPPLKADENEPDHEFGIVLVVPIYSKRLMKDPIGAAKYVETNNTDYISIVNKIQDLEKYAVELLPEKARQALEIPIPNPTKYRADIYIIPAYVYITDDEIEYNAVKSWKDDSPAKGVVKKPETFTSELKRKLANVSDPRTRSMIRMPATMQTKKTNFDKDSVVSNFGLLNTSRWSLAAAALTTSSSSVVKTAPTDAELINAMRGVIHGSDLDTLTFQVVLDLLTAKYGDVSTKKPLLKAQLPIILNEVKD